MTVTKLTSIILIILLFCLKISHSGVKKIKIHVPYYVKHVHHLKKIYVPKIHVIKHEHHHKKEYDHHHHHHEVHKVHHVPYRTYDKSSHEYPDEYGHHDFFYDDIESKSFRERGKRRQRPSWKYRASGSEVHYGWKDADGGDESGEYDDDYAAYRKSYNFKRRADVGGKQEDRVEGEGVSGAKGKHGKPGAEGGEKEEEEEEEEDGEEEEEEEEEGGAEEAGEDEAEDEDVSDESTVEPINEDKIISITTTTTQNPFR